MQMENVTTRFTIRSLNQIRNTTLSSMYTSARSRLLHVDSNIETANYTRYAGTVGGANHPTTKASKHIEPAATIYVITPTYARKVQKAELTRVSQTFSHLTGFHWIVVEDAVNKTELVSNFLKNSDVEGYTHLNVKSSLSTRTRGIAQRNLALDWVLDNTNGTTDKGVVYFADDDNTYDLKIFHEVRECVKAESDRSIG